MAKRHGLWTSSAFPVAHALAWASNPGHSPQPPLAVRLPADARPFTALPALGDDRAQAVDNADDGNWTADMARDKRDFPGAARWPAPRTGR